MKRITWNALIGVAALLICGGYRAAEGDEKSAQSGAKPVELFVAVNGSDAWSGRLPEPNAERTDGPFATMGRARDEIRKIKQVGPLPQGGVAVEARGGIFELAETFKLTADDSGTEAAPVVYRAYANEKPILIGGKRITGFVPHKDGILKTDMAAQGFKGIYFRQLFFDGKRQVLARFPNCDPDNPVTGGWSYVDGKPIPMYKKIEGESRRTLQFKPEDIHEWAHPEEGEVVVFPQYNWWNNIIRMASIDWDKHIMTLVADASYPNRPNDRYYVRNLFEELDAPGEWYLDKRTWTLYFRPPTDTANPAVYAPILENIVDMTQASHIILRGFAIECCEGTAMILRRCSNCLVAGNTIHNVGGRADAGLAAIHLAGGRNNGAAGNDIYEVGSRGIFIEGGERETLTPGGNYADNNYIHHTGTFYKQGAGVTVLGVGNRVSHNLIHDGPRYGVEFNGNDHIIEYNHIRHCNLETDDTGGIEAWQVDWTKRGTEIRFNFVQDNIGFGQKMGKWVQPGHTRGIYLDDGVCGTHVFGNIVVRNSVGCGIVHGGRDNVYENNIFVDGRDMEMEYHGYVAGGHPVPMMTEAWSKFSGTPAYEKYPGYTELKKSLENAWQMAGNKFLRNIVCYSNPSAKLYSHGNLPFDKTESDYNLIWHFGLPIHCGLKSVSPEQQWEEWKKLGFEQHSLIAAPKFMDPAKDDYRLQSDSPALALGFQPIPVDKIGPYQDPLRATWPIQEAEGAREKMKVDWTTQAEPPPPPRNTTPFVAKRAAPVNVDGVLSPGEWPEAQMVVKQAPDRMAIDGAPCIARACHDGANLYVSITVPLSSAAKLKLESAWGRNDGAEVCFQDLSGPKPGPTFVIHGFACGKQESVTDGGAPEEAAKRLGAAVRFAAKVEAKQWTGEWRIPLEAAGIAYRSGLKLAFNLGAFRSETGDWIIWVGALGETWRLENAGFLILE